MRYRKLQAEAEVRHLTILGGFHPLPADAAPEGCQTLVMLGPDEPDFWPAFQASSEAGDGKPDPMDRWSARVIDLWADDLDATALYPFGGPPYLPFFSWAERTGRVHPSPIRLLVHDRAGLFVSFRGALALREHIVLPPAPPAPCTTCVDTPCLDTCPVQAFDGRSYDVAGCKTFLGGNDGSDCMSHGCKARRSCPISARYPRLPAQSAFHMKAFKGPAPCSD